MTKLCLTAAAIMLAAITTSKAEPSSEKWEFDGRQCHVRKYSDRLSKVGATRSPFTWMMSSNSKSTFATSRRVTRSGNVLPIATRGKLSTVIKTIGGGATFFSDS